MAEKRTYRGWKVYQGRWPEPAWQATHDDYDASYEGEEDGWVDNGLKASGDTLDELKAEIDEIMCEHPHFRHCDDCDFTTAQSDVTICPDAACRGSVG